MAISSSSSSEISGASDSESELRLDQFEFERNYDAFRLLVFDVAAFGGFFRFLGAGLVVDEVDSGEPSRDSEIPMPAASRKSPRRSSSASIFVLY
jgi:hypothetical protein